MGVKNRERRAAKQRARQRRGRTGQDPGARRAGAKGGPGGPPTLAELVRAAVLAVELDRPDSSLLLTALAARGPAATAALDGLLDAEVAALWTRGWTPADAAVVVSHTLSSAHAAIATAAVVREGQKRRAAGDRLHPRWEGQLDALAERAAPTAAAVAGGSAAGAGEAAVSEVRLRVEVLLLFANAPRIPVTIPPPGAGPGERVSVPTHLDERILARVRGLLAKAESTDYAEEAEALTAKAQELIARHAIADALLHRETGDAPPASRRVPVPNPYAHPKAALLAEIACANRCRATWSANLGWSTVFGFDADLDAVELLFASLLAQAGAAMGRLGSRRDHVGRSRTTSFRRSFLLGFAQQIGERLRRATDSEVAAADGASGGALLPVLAAREDRVRAAQEAAFPDQQARSTTVSNAAGWAAGKSAGQLALLDLSAGALKDAQRA